MEENIVWKIVISLNNGEMKDQSVNKGKLKVKMG